MKLQFRINAVEVKEHVAGHDDQGEKIMVQTKNLFLVPTKADCNKACWPSEPNGGMNLCFVCPQATKEFELGQLVTVEVTPFKAD